MTEKELGGPRRAGRAYTAAEAEAVVRAAGYEPCEPYPGIASAPWKLECTSCHRVRRARLASVVRRGPCKHTSTGVLPVRELAERFDKGESLRALGGELGVSEQTVRRQIRGLKSRSVPTGAPPKYTAVQAEAILRAARMTPLGPYPGLANSPWPATCDVCGRPRKMSLGQVVRGKRCSHRGGGLAAAAVPVAAVVAAYNAGASVRALADEYQVSYGKMHSTLSGLVEFRGHGGK